MPFTGSDVTECESLLIGDRRMSGKPLPEWRTEEPNPGNMFPLLRFAPARSCNGPGVLTDFVVSESSSMVSNKRDSRYKLYRSGRIHKYRGWRLI